MRQDDLKKKRSQKRTNQVPVQELGFKAKIYYGLQTEYTRRRVRYKAVKYGAQSSKQSFMARLRFTIDVTSLNHEDLQNLPNFKGIRKQEWCKIKHIVYHSKQQLNCPICLQQTFRAPQMTSCGHVFCWHCIYMHVYKSLKANHCPVCNQALQIQNLVTCILIFSKSFAQLKENKVHFTLMARRQNDNRIYNPENLNEILSFGRIVKALPEKILSIYREQLKSIEEHAKIQQDVEIKKWIEKVHALCWQKIDKIQQNMPKKQYKLHRKQRLQNGVIHSVLEQKQKNSLVTFYQQASGRLIFLHPICEKYLRKSQKELPKELTEEIVYWQEAEYNIDLMKRYRNISHITINQQIDIIIINMDHLIQGDLLTAFQEQLQHFNQRKKEQLQRQEKEAEKLAIKYEQQKQYLARLKKMEESQFYDIRVPVTIDLSQIGSTAFFPSLIQTRSLPQPRLQSPKESEKKKNGKPQTKVINQEDFPGLKLAPKQINVQTVNFQQPPLKLLNFKSEENTANTFIVQKYDFPVLQQLKKQQSQVGGKRKKKKQKFVNVTDMFFKEPDQEF